MLPRSWRCSPRPVPYQSTDVHAFLIIKESPQSRSLSPLQAQLGRQRSRRGPYYTGWKHFPPAQCNAFSVGDMATVLRDVDLMFGAAFAEKATMEKRVPLRANDAVCVKVPTLRTVRNAL